MTISILLVEDNPDWQKILRRKLSTALKEISILDPKIEIVNTFDEADRALDVRPWNLLVTDIGLGASPLQSQQKLGIHLIEFAHDRQIPAIAVSGTPVVDNQDVSDLYLENRVSAFFSKRPFKSDKFIKKVQELLQKNDSSNLEKFMKDVFICHASEDKLGVVEPLVDAFDKSSISYWYDKAEIKWGDNITKKVNEGLSISRFVIVVLSKAFLSKNFPQHELYSALNIEIYSTEVKVLPLIIKSDNEEKGYILQKLPLLADKAYLTWNGNAKEIIDALQVRLAEKKPQEFDQTDNDENPLPSNGIIQNKTKQESFQLQSTEPLIDFAIITAIEVERNAVCKAFGFTDKDRVKKESRVYWQNRFNLKDGGFYEIVVAQSPDMANVDAALLTSDTIHHWHPASILMVGIAGAASEEEKLGDLIIGSSVYYYERGKEIPAGNKPEPYMYPSDATLWSRVTSLPKWTARIPVKRPGIINKERPSIYQGVIASGERVIADAAVRDEIAAGQRKIRAIEMEGYGFSKAAWQSFERVRHLVIRAICDRADSSKNSEWHSYAAAVSAEFTKHFLGDRPLEPRIGNSKKLNG